MTQIVDPYITRCGGCDQLVALEDDPGDTVICDECSDGFNPFTTIDEHPTSTYILEFGCCGHTIGLGDDAAVGTHGEHCLRCDTDDPDTTVRRTHRP
jgi:hypothetical protein